MSSPVSWDELPRHHRYRSGDTEHSFPSTLDKGKGRHCLAETRSIMDAQMEALSVPISCASGPKWVTGRILILGTLPQLTHLIST